jgi:uncharacterized membrane protein YqaE (UPF0057 family)
MAQQAANEINANQWTLFDKIMYGGLGYGAFCLPSDFFKVIIAIIFPPLGHIINVVEDTVSDTFPYFTWETLYKLFSNEAITQIVYSLILTTLFYIPGLVYTLTIIVNKERKVAYDKSYIYENPKIAQPSNEVDWDGIASTGENIGNKVRGVGKSVAGRVIDTGETAVDEIEEGVDTAFDEIGGLF